MTDKIIISRKEIEALLDGGIGWYEDDIRALLDKAEVSGEDSLTTNNLRACGEYLDNEKCLLEMVRELQAREKVLVKLVLTTGLRAYPNKTKHQIQDEITNMLANVRGE